MGCGKSKGGPEEGLRAAREETPLVPDRPVQTPAVDLGNARREEVLRFGWGCPGVEVVVEPPDARDPPFLQTVAPSGTTWGQYVRTCSSFVDPKTGFLAGPWAECIAWAVVFEHVADWDKMPQYHQDGVVGPVLQAMEEVLRRHSSLGKAAFLQAADRLEDAAHELAESGQHLPEVRQVVLLPGDCSPGSVVRCENPQIPGSSVMVKVPSTAQPQQPLLLAVPVQPSKSGELLTGEEVPFRIGALPWAMPGDLAWTALNRDAEGRRVSRKSGAGGGPRPSDHCMGQFEGEAIHNPGFFDSLF